MPDYPPSRGHAESETRPASTLITVGTALFGTVGGGVLGAYVIGALLSRSTSGGPYDGFGLAIFWLYGMIGSAIIGTIIGWFVGARLSRQARSKSIGIVLASLGAAACLFLGYKYWLLCRAADTAVAEVRARSAIHDQQMAAYDRKANTHLPTMRAPVTARPAAPVADPPPTPVPVQPAEPVPTPTPFPITTADVSAAYADLVYPNSQFVPLRASTLHPEIPVAFAMLDSHDSFEQTVAYYRSRVTTTQDTPTLFTGIRERQSDHRMTTIQVINFRGRISVGLKVY